MTYNSIYLSPRNSFILLAIIMNTLDIHSDVHMKPKNFPVDTRLRKMLYGRRGSVFREINEDWKMQCMWRHDCRSVYFIWSSKENHVDHSRSNLKSLSMLQQTKKKCQSSYTHKTKNQVVIWRFQCHKTPLSTQRQIPERGKGGKKRQPSSERSFPYNPFLIKENSSQTILLSIPNIAKQCVYPSINSRTCRVGINPSNQLRFPACQYLIKHLEVVWMGKNEEKSRGVLRMWTAFI